MIGLAIICLRCLWWTPCSKAQLLASYNLRNGFHIYHPNQNALSVSINKQEEEGLLYIRNKHGDFSLVLLYLENLLSHLIQTELIQSHDFFIISTMSLFTVGHNTIVPLTFIASKHLYQLLSSCWHCQWMIVPWWTTAYCCMFASSGR